MTETNITRPTIDEILAEPTRGASSWVIAELAAHGYVIVHPDDVPEGRMPIEPGRVYTYTPGTPTYDDGWNACRAHIFGDETQ